MTFDRETLFAPEPNLTPARTETAALARAGLPRSAAQVRQTAANCPGSGLSGNVVIDSYIGESRGHGCTRVDDFENLINWMKAKGQVRGSAARGIGWALNKLVAHDAWGQRLTASLVDYALPHAAQIPIIKFTSAPVPSMANPKGMKGCGEAGTEGALAAIANAVQDALWDHGVRQADMPFTPHKVWELLNDGSVAAE